MQLAQKLYESGHITYMRTDGSNVAPAAVQALRSAAEIAHGSAYLPPQPRVYSRQVSCRIELCISDGSINLQMCMALNFADISEFVQMECFKKRA